MSKITNELVTDIKEVQNKSGKGTHPVVSLDGHKYPYNVAPKIKDVFKGPGKYKIEWIDTEYQGKTYENISGAEFISSVAPAEVAKIQTSTRTAQDKGMVYSSAVNAVKDIVNAYITTTNPQPEKEKYDLDGEPMDPSEAPEISVKAQIVLLTSDLLKTFLDELDSRFGVKVD